MPAAHRDTVRDFATTDLDIRMDIATQLVSRRERLGYTQLQLAESARVTEMNLTLVERGVAFDGSHDIACAALLAVERLESLRDGTAHLRVV